MAKKLLSDETFHPSANGQPPPTTPYADDRARQERKSILERMREEQPYMDDVGAEIKTSISWRRPSPLDWFRVHPDLEYRAQAYLLTLRRSQRPYVIFGDVLQHVLRTRKQGKDVTIYTCIDRYGDVFLWDIGLNPNDWNTSARRAALRAQEMWVRLVSNQTLQRYQHEESTKIAAPVWPTVSFDTMITEIFEDHVIDSPSHELIQALLGEA